MLNYKEIAITMLIYLIGGLLVLFSDDILVVIAVIILLGVFHLIALYTKELKYEEERESEQSKLQYKLDKTKQETSETTTQFMSLIEVIGSGVLLIDEEGIIQLTNQTFNEYFQLYDVKGKSYKSFEPIDQLYKVFREAYISERKVREQINVNKHYYDLVFTPIFDSTIYRGTLVLIHDITQLKTAEQFQKQFTADVSHELKSPLSAIKGFSEILSRNEEVSKAEEKEFIELINHEASRLETIINDLLVIAKMDRIDYELHLDETSMEMMVHEAVKLLKNAAKKKSLELNVEVEEHILIVDQVKMRQVVINLIRNAINYTDKGTVDIKGYTTDKYYIIEVTDTGIGIKDEHKALIFKRFYRVDEARSRDTGGSGLGLSIIKNVVKKHGGRIELTSEINKGSTFKVYLPLKK